MLSSSLLVSWALSLSGCSEPASSAVTLSLTASADPRGDAAVIVAISDFVFLPDVAGAVDNARDWQQWLTGSGHLPASRVTVLADQTTTFKENILGTIDTAAATVDVDHRLWVIFIGRGAPDPETGEHTLLGVDTQNTERSIRTRGIAQSTLIAHALKTRGHAVIIVDDEVFGPSDDPRRPRPPCGHVPRLRPDPRLLYLGTQRAAANVTYLRPPVSFLVLGALRGHADVDGNGVVTLGETRTFMDKTLSAVSTSSTRVEIVGHEASVLGRCGSEKAPSLTAIRTSLVGSAPERAR